MQVGSSWIGKLKGARAEILAAKLYDVLPIDIPGVMMRFVAGKDAEEYDRVRYERALERLDQLELVF